MFSLYYLFIIDILLNSMLKKMKVTKLLDLRRKKYLFKSTHRGTKEIDILLGRFVEMNINKLCLGCTIRVNACFKLNDT